MKFLKGFFCLGSQGRGYVDAREYASACDPRRSDDRLHRATNAALHSHDHYGQMVEYLRNGIVPPACRGVRLIAAPKWRAKS